MLHIEDNAIILSTRKHAENSALVAMLTQKHGLYRGVVRGATSKNNRGIYQAGNLVVAKWSARLPEHMGSISAELLSPFAAHIMQSREGLVLLSSACVLLDVALPERHSYHKLYTALAHLLAHLAHGEGGLNEYIEFELLLLAETGFGLDLGSCAATGSNDNLIYVSPKSGRAVSASAGEPYKDKLLPMPPTLDTTAYFLEHWLFESLGKKIPAARRRLINAA